MNTSSHLRLLAATLCASVTSLQAAPVVDSFDLTNIYDAGSATFTTTSSYANAWVVVGWTFDTGFRTTTAANFNGGADMVAIHPSLNGQYDGGAGNFQMYYQNVGALAAGTQTISITTTATSQHGLVVFIVDGVAGFRDTAYATYRDDDNGGSGGNSSTFGFNLSPTPAFPAATAISSNPLTSSSGDVVVGFVSSGASFGSQYVDGDILGLTTTNAPSTLVLGGGGSYAAGSTVVATANQEFAYEGVRGAGSFDGWYRIGIAAIAFETGSAVPEPSTYATLAGLGALGFAALRRRRA